MSIKKSEKGNRAFTMSRSEIMTIMILFHCRGFRNFKMFYIHYVQKHMQSEFPKTVSYTRFVELEKKVCVPLAVFIKTISLGKCISKDLFEQLFVDGVYIVTKIKKNMKNSLMLMHDKIMLKKRVPQQSPLMTN